MCWGNIVLIIVTIDLALQEPLIDIVLIIEQAVAEGGKPARRSASAISHVRRTLRYSWPTPLEPNHPEQQLASPSHYRKHTHRKPRQLPQAYVVEKPISFSGIDLDILDLVREAARSVTLARYRHHSGARQHNCAVIRYSGRFGLRKAASCDTANFVSEPGDASGFQARRAQSEKDNTKVFIPFRNQAPLMTEERSSDLSLEKELRESVEADRQQCDEQ